MVATVRSPMCSPSKGAVPWFRIHQLSVVVSGVAHEMQTAAGCAGIQKQISDRLKAPVFGAPSVHIYSDRSEIFVRAAALCLHDTNECLSIVLLTLTLIPSSALHIML